MHLNSSHIIVYYVHMNPQKSQSSSPCCLPYACINIREKSEELIFSILNTEQRVIVIVILQR